MNLPAHTHVILTGGTGFFGRALLRRWTEREQTGQTVPEVTILTRAPDVFARRFPELVSPRWLHLLRGDVCRPETLPAGVAFSHVLHAATDSTLGVTLTPMQRYDQIVDGTRNVLRMAVACGAKRFLLTSSGGVYGTQPLELDRMPEVWNGMPDPLEPGNAYSVAKRAAEHLCALYHDAHGLETVIARCFSFVGRDLPLDAHFAIGNFMRDALLKDEIVVAGNGTPIRSYMDQRDLADWLITMLEHGQACRAYNVGSDQAISIARLAALVRDVLSPDKPVRILSGQEARPNRSIYVPDITRAREELALKPSISLDQAILAAVTATPPISPSGRPSG